MDREVRIVKPGEGLVYVPLPALKPLVGFNMTELLNINDALYMSPFKRKDAIRATRGKGYRYGLQTARILGIPEKTVPVKKGSKEIRGAYKTILAYPITRLKIFSVLYVWHGRSIKDAALPARTQDIYNPLVKGFIDGLTDAGLWEDDNARYHTDYAARYMGLADSNVYELMFYGIENPSGE
jgi:hypothetical protein